MAFGLGRLALPPSVFWTMTPREIAAAVAGVFGRAPLPPERADLAALMARFPDNRP